MTSDELKAIQAPIKAGYRESPGGALRVLRVVAELDPARIVVRVPTSVGTAEAGLHEAAGGPGDWACSADMLLESLAACAGVTLLAVATAMKIEVRGGTVSASGPIDFRGTLGVSREVPVGFGAIEVRFELDAGATPEQLEGLATLTERYCVIAQSLKTPPKSR